MSSNILGLASSSRFVLINEQRVLKSATHRALLFWSGGDWETALFAIVDAAAAAATKLPLLLPQRLCLSAKGANLYLGTFSLKQVHATHSPEAVAIH